MTHPVRLVTTALLLTLVAACDSPTETPAAGAAVARIDLWEPLPEYAFVGRALAPKVRLYDAGNQWVAGATVDFTSARGTTTLATSSSVSDDLGIASPGAWSLPTRPTVDTPVVTVRGARNVAPLRIPMSVRAGPVARWVTLAPTTGEGTVLQAFFTGDALRAFDPYDNPVGLAAARVETTPGDGAARVAATLDADANGVFHLAEWVPRVLGTHTLRLVPTDGESIASPVLSRTVRQPACAPSAFIPDRGGEVFPAATLSGVLRDDPGAACADSVDRWAIGVDSMRFMSFGVREAQGTRDLPFRIVRAGTTDTVGIIVPDTMGVVSGFGSADVVLPRGEYELVVKSGSVTGRVPYDIAWRDYGAATNFRPSYFVQSAEGRFYAGNDVQVPEAGAPTASGKLFVVPMRDPSHRRLQVTATATADWAPTIAVYGRRDGSSERSFIGVATEAGSARTLSVDVPATYQEALVYVLRPKPVPSNFLGEFRVRID